MRLPSYDREEYYAYYTEAIQQKERQGMPSVGVSSDRRAFKHLDDVCNDNTVYSIVCFVCAQIHTHGGDSRKEVRTRHDGSKYVAPADLSSGFFESASFLAESFRKDPERFESNLGFARCCR